ncbi:hypothetical protein RST01_11160 [Rummeliibacillus stabekisii]|nr:hypothetical protein RST01_11160 [Rummeliibacillus stabekisii]
MEKKVRCAYSAENRVKQISRNTFEKNLFSHSILWNLCYDNLCEIESRKPN